MTSNQDRSYVGGEHAVSSGIAVAAVESHPMSGEHAFSRGAAPREPRDPSNKHFVISMVKSVLRMIGYMWLPVSIVVGVIWLILAEVLGVLEEL